MPDPYHVIPRVLEVYASGAKPGNGDFQYLGDKFPRVYKKNYSALLESLAAEEFADLTLIHVTRSPLEVINSIVRRINNAKLGIDSWRAIESLDEAIYEWKSSWNSRKLLYSKIPFKNVIDLNYNYLVNDPRGSLSKISDMLGVDNLFDCKIVSKVPIDWCLDEPQRLKINSSFPPIMLCDDWQKFGLLLDRHTFCFK